MDAEEVVRVREGWMRKEELTDVTSPCLFTWLQRTPQVVLLPASWGFFTPGLVVLQESFMMQS